MLNMNHYKEQRVCVLVDVQNMYYSAKNLYNSKVNFDEIMKTALGSRKLIRAIAYVIKADVKDEKVFHEALEKLGFEVKIKDLLVFHGGNKKGDWDIGIAMDAVRAAEKVDVIVVVSGDGDFKELYEYVRGKGCRIEVIAFGKTASSSIKGYVDHFVDMDNKKKYLISLKNNGDKKINHSMKDFTKNNPQKSGFVKKEYTKSEFAKTEFPKKDFVRKDTDRTDFVRNDNDRKDFVRKDTDRTDFVRKDNDRKDFVRNDYVRKDFVKKDYPKKEFTRNQYHNREFTSHRFERKEFIPNNSPARNNDLDFDIMQINSSQPTQIRTTVEMPKTIGTKEDLKKIPAKPISQEQKEAKKEDAKKAPVKKDAPKKEAVKIDKGKQGIIKKIMKKMKK